MKAIILVAGLGKRLRGLTNLPKCLLNINGIPLIHRYLFFLKDWGLKEIAIVVGYKKDKIIKEAEKFKHLIKIKIINNPDFSQGSILSLWRAKDELSEDTLLMDGDVYFEFEIIKKIFTSKKKNFLLIDTTAKFDSEAILVGFRNNRAAALARGLKGNYDVLGEWVGFLRLSTSSSKRLKEVIKSRVAQGEKEIGYEFIIPDLFKNTPVSYELVNGLKWVEIDFPEDIKKAKHLNILN